MFSIALQGLSPLLHLQQDRKTVRERERKRENERESILVGELYHTFGLPERKLDLFHNCNVNKQKTVQI